MQLTLHTDYALRLLIFVSRAPGGQVTVPAAAAALEVSEHHLAKVAQRLVKEGALRSARGRNGGLSLGEGLDELRLGALVRRLEPPGGLVACFDPDGRCTLDGECGLQGVLAEARTAFYATLDRRSVADILGPPG